MIPVPKPKFFERKIPAGQSEDDYFDEICERQAHVLGDAIDRVSFFCFHKRSVSYELFGTGCGEPRFNLTGSYCGGLCRRALLPFP